MFLHSCENSKLYEKTGPKWISKLQSTGAFFCCMLLFIVRALTLENCRNNQNNLLALPYIIRSHF